MPEQVQADTPDGPPRGDTRLSILLHLREAWLGFNRRGQLRAAALSYYALLSLFPLLVLMLFTANQLWGEAIVQEQAERLAQRFFPGDVPAMIISSVASALKQEQSLSIVALAGLLWAASSFFSNLTVALDTIFERTDNGRPMWRNRVVGAVTVIVLALLLIVTVIATYGLRLFSQSILEYPGIVMRPLSLLIPLLLNTFILLAVITLTSAVPGPRAFSIRSKIE